MLQHLGDRLGPYSKHNLGTENKTTSQQRKQKLVRRRFLSDRTDHLAPFTVANNINKSSNNNKSFMDFDNQDKDEIFHGNVDGAFQQQNGSSNNLLQPQSSTFSANLGSIPVDNQLTRFLDILKIFLCKEPLDRLLGLNEIQRWRCEIKDSLSKLEKL